MKKKVLTENKFFSDLVFVVVNSINININEKQNTTNNKIYILYKTTPTHREKKIQNVSNIIEMIKSM